MKTQRLWSGWTNVGFGKSDDLLKGAMAAMAVACIVAAPVLAQTTSAQRESAVMNARAGHRAEAIDALRALLGSPHDDGRVAFDLTTLLQEDGKSLEAATV